MKKLILSSLFCVVGLSQLYAQNNPVKYTITKSYDGNGNVIRYDSTQVDCDDYSKNRTHFKLNWTNMDSLTVNLKKVGVFLSDSITVRLDRMLKSKDFKIWMETTEDGFTQNFSFDWESKDSLANKNKVRHYFRKFFHDSVKKVRLEKQIKRMEKELNKIEQRLKQQ